MTRHVVIGDVHGMIEELQKLFDELKSIGIKKEDPIIFVGDLLDKGPDSKGVLEFLRFEIDLGQKIILVEGNHEEKHKRYRKHCIENPEIAKSMESLQPELSSITKSLTKDNIDLLENAIPFFRIEKHNFLIVHGGIPNNMWNFPTSLEEINASSKSKKYFSQTLRTRYVCSKTGRMLDLGKEGPDDLYWADVYNGRFGTVIFGHQPFPNRPKIFPNAIGIDTGAVYGYGLTAMIVEESGSYNFITVPTQEYQTYNKYY